MHFRARFDYARLAPGWSFRRRGEAELRPRKGRARFRVDKLGGARGINGAFGCVAIPAAESRSSSAVYVSWFDLQSLGLTYSKRKVELAWH